MATEFITTNQTTAYTIDNLDVVFLLEGVRMTSTSSAFASFFGPTGGELHLAGYIYAGSDILNVDTASSVFEITIAPTSVLMASDDGFVFGSLVGGVRVQNAGFLSTGEAGIWTASSSVNTVELFNSGTIMSDGNADQGTVYVGNLATIVNTGTLQAFQLTGDYATVVHSYNAGTLDLLNSGSILAGGANAIVSVGNANIRNTGLIDGDIILSAGNDTFDGRGGTVTGTVFGGAGNDTYIIDGTGTDLVEDADEGADTVRSTGSFTLGDNFEALALIGADDTKGQGNALDNDLTGNDGDNRLSGRGGIDTVNGGAGDDILRGNRGADALNGDDGEDRLFGGLDADTLTGGEDEDHFVFTRKAHSLKAAFDTIIDFEKGLDLIDLTDLVAGKIKFHTGLAMTGGGKAEIGTKVVGSDTRVFIDIDGNGTRDMRIDVLDVTDLDASDFLL